MKWKMKFADVTFYNFHLPILSDDRLTCAARVVVLCRDDDFTAHTRWTQSSRPTSIS